MEMPGCIASNECGFSNFKKRRKCYSCEYTEDVQEDVRTRPTASRDGTRDIGTLASPMLLLRQLDKATPPEQVPWLTRYTILCLN
jgi:hypothetical protein